MSALSNNVSRNHGQGLMDESASMITIKTNPSSSVKANPQMEQVDDFVTSIYQHAHLLGGPRFHGTMGEG